MNHPLKCSAKIKTKINLLLQTMKEFIMKIKVIKIVKMGNQTIKMIK